MDNATQRQKSLIPGLTKRWPLRVPQALGRFLPGSLVEVVLNRVSAGLGPAPVDLVHPAEIRELIREIARRAGPFLRNPEAEGKALEQALTHAFELPGQATGTTSRVIAVESETDIHEARTECVRTTKEMGLGVLVRTAAATIVSELARNIVRHAGTGKLSVSIDEDDLVICARDRGPGFRAPDAAVQNELRRTRRSGFDAIRRLADEVEVDQRPGGGTRVTVRLRIA